MLPTRRDQFKGCPHPSQAPHRHCNGRGAPHLGNSGREALFYNATNVSLSSSMVETKEFYYLNSTGLHGQRAPGRGRRRRRVREAGQLQQRGGGNRIPPAGTPMAWFPHPPSLAFLCPFSSPAGKRSPNSPTLPDARREK